MTDYLLTFFKGVDKNHMRVWSIIFHLLHLVKTCLQPINFLYRKIPNYFAPLNKMFCFTFFSVESFICTYLTS